MFPADRVDKTWLAQNVSKFRAGAADKVYTECTGRTTASEPVESDRDAGKHRPRFRDGFGEPSCISLSTHGRLMQSGDIAVHVQQWANDVLVWVGFGTLVGLLAKAIMPGRDPGGAVATLAMGVGGTMIGCGIASFFYPGQRVTPISPLGFLVATAGAFVILFFYRLLAGKWFVEGDAPRRRRVWAGPRLRKAG
jgi:uncharacterized membrane protein YeaQ/YmgE (transglycosylase-associated protein family)